MSKYVISIKFKSGETENIVGEGRAREAEEALVVETPDGTTKVRFLREIVGYNVKPYKESK